MKMILKVDNASPQMYGKRLPLFYKMKIESGYTQAYNAKINLKNYARNMLK